MSLDGKSLYLAAFNKILRVRLPEGGEPEELGFTGIATDIKVSPDGSRIVFTRPVGGFELGMMNTDGSGARIIFQAPSDLIEDYGQPIWLGNDRILLPAPTPMAGGSPTRVLEFAAPDWQESEYLPLQNALSHSLDVLAASPDGERLFLVECRPECSNTVPVVPTELSCSISTIRSEDASSYHLTAATCSSVAMTWRSLISGPVAR